MRTLCHAMRISRRYYSRQLLLAISIDTADLQAAPQDSEYLWASLDVPILKLKAKTGSHPRYFNMPTSGLGILDVPLQSGK